MKKVIAIVLSLAVIFTLSAVAFATTSSPVAKTEAKVIVREAGVEGHEAGKQFDIKVGEGFVKVSAIASKGTFNGWSIYKIVNGNAVQATLGTDYEVTEGSLSNPNMTVVPKTDIIICADYNGVKTAPGNFDEGGNSPKTADMSVAYAVIVMMAAAAFAVSAKKVFSK